MSDDLERQVIELIGRRTKLDPAAITPDSTFAALGIDSLDAADLLFTFEDTFHIVIPDEAAQDMKNVRQIVEGLRRILDGTAPPDAS